MLRLVKFYHKYLARLNKYWLVILLFVAFTFFIGDSTLLRHHRLDDRIRALENEINRYEKQIERDRQKIRELHTDKEGLEQFAREEYLMKKENEDLFIVEE
jgi:cell division protein FtsB